jgi:FMN-dependent NADH-azoreductase
MTSLLQLDSSADRSPESISRRLTALFADSWRDHYGSSLSRYRDLAADPVPPVDTAFCALARRLEKDGLVSSVVSLNSPRTPPNGEAWATTYRLVQKVLTADTIVIGAPMYNFSVPASLKAWLDRISLPGALLNQGDEHSALENTKVVVIVSGAARTVPALPESRMTSRSPTCGRTSTSRTCPRRTSGS